MLHHVGDDWALGTPRRLNGSQQDASASMMRGSGAAYLKETWTKAIRDRLTRLLKLPRGWDGYEGQTPSIEAALFSMEILAGSWRSRLPVPDISPKSDGGLLIEWMGEDAELTVEVSGPYSVYVTYEEAGEVQETELGKDLSPLEAFLDMYVQAAQ